MIWSCSLTENKRIIALHFRASCHYSIFSFFIVFISLLAQAHHLLFVLGSVGEMSRESSGARLQARPTGELLYLCTCLLCGKSHRALTRMGCC